MEKDRLKDNNMASNEIIIRDFQKGISSVPTSGFEAIVNCDINSYPGTIFPNFAPAKESSTTFTDTVNAMAGAYALDDDGVIATFAGSEIAARPHNYKAGLAWWKNTLFHIGPTSIDTWDSTNGWISGWDTTKDSSDPAFSFVATNDVLYIAAGRYVYRVVEDTTFDAATPATYTITARALDLPSNYTIKAFSQVGSYLAILANNDTGNGALFLWDTVSTSFEEPIIFNEIANQMIAYNGLLYLNMGYHCSFYISNGSSVSGPYKFPLSSIESDSNIPLELNLSFKPNAIDIVRDRVFFGLSAVGSDIVPKGIYSFNPSNKKFQCENILSTGNKAEIAIGVIRKVPNTNSPYAYRFGYGDFTSGDTDYGIDKVGTDSRVSNYNAYFISQFYTVGTKLRPRTFKEIQLAFRKAANGSTYNVRIEYRKDRRYNTWTTINTTEIDITNLITNYNIPFALRDIYGIQFKVSFSGNTDTMAELEEIRIN